MAEEHKQRMERLNAEINRVAKPRNKVKPDQTQSELLGKQDLTADPNKDDENPSSSDSEEDEE